MSEVELYFIEQGENCTVCTLQFLRDSESEFEKFVSKFIDSPSIMKTILALPLL